MLVSVCSGRQNKRSSRSYVCQENTVQYDPQVASQTDIVISVIYIPIHSTVKDLTDYDVKAMLTSDTWSAFLQVHRGIYSYHCQKLHQFTTGIQH